MAKRSRRSKASPPVGPSIVTAQPVSAIEQLRASLTSSVLGYLFTGLVSLAIFCAVLLYNAEKTMRDIQVPVKQAMEDDHNEIANARKFYRSRLCPSEPLSERLALAGLLA